MTLISDSQTHNLSQAWVRLTLLKTSTPTEYYIYRGAYYVVQSLRTFAKCWNNKKPNKNLLINYQIEHNIYTNPPELDIYFNVTKVATRVKIADLSK